MLDFEEEYLISLCIKYRESFEKLNQTVKELELSREYGRGGRTLHRGFYCPSPVQDIIIGGCDSGRLVRKPKSELPVDYIYRKASDKLIIVDKNAFKSDNTFFLSTREFIIDNKAEVIAPKYDMSHIAYSSTSHDLSFFSLCRYDSSGRIIKYLTIQPDFSLTGDTFTVNKKRCFYCGEQFSYNEQTGLLESVIIGQKMGIKSFEDSDSYRFFHDEIGYLVSYQNIKTGTLREIAKRKRRMI